MKHTIEVNGIKLQVTATLAAQGVKFPFEKETKENRNILFHNQFRISIETEYINKHNNITLIK